jgi:ribosomal protein S18 acetylase RimI-like enzyme
MRSQNSSSTKASAKGKKNLKNAEKAQKDAEKEVLAKQISEIYAIPDLLESLSKFKTFTKNDLNLRIEAIPISKVPRETFKWIFDLLKTNMESFYEQTWGWSDSGKRNELKEGAALYLIAYETVDGKEVPVGYSHFRFDYEEDKKTNVLYMYELQIEKRAQGKGLGRFLMQILELLTIKHGMACLMLTVFLCNKDAMAFYQKMRYEIDSTSPSKDIEYLTSADPIDFEILSKTFRK